MSTSVVPPEKFFIDAKIAIEWCTEDMEELNTVVNLKLAQKQDTLDRDGWWIVREGCSASNPSLITNPKNIFSNASLDWFKYSALEFDMACIM